MNQAKIGKLIAKLRKAKNLTQQDLGDMVGVGYRSVSKWERGLSLPDISIINKLCEILGITSDELLKAELNNPIKIEKKFNKKILWLVPLFVVVAIVIIYINGNSNKQQVYNLESIDSNYYVEGKVVFDDDIFLIFISNIGSSDYEFNHKVIKNYEYKLLSSNVVIYGAGYNQLTDNIDSSMTVEEFFDSFKMDYKTEAMKSVDEVINEPLVIQFGFIDENNNEFIKNINIRLSSQINK